MNDRLNELYEAARDGEFERYSYMDYCNSRISGQVAGENAIELTQYIGGGEETVCFDIQNLPPDVFQDRVAVWLVTGEVKWSDRAKDPLEW